MENLNVIFSPNFSEKLSMPIKKNQRTFEEVPSLIQLPKEFDLNVVSHCTAAGN